MTWLVAVAWFILAAHPLYAKVKPCCICGCRGSGMSYNPCVNDFAGTIMKCQAWCRDASQDQRRGGKRMDGTLQRLREHSYITNYGEDTGCPVAALHTKIDELETQLAAEHTRALLAQKEST